MYFRPDENAGAGIRRLLCEELDDAIALTRQAALDLDDVVHDTRKKIKRVRALLRLIEPELGAIYDHENAALREVAQKFSSIREAKAELEALDKLERSPGALLPERFEAARRGLRSESGAARKDVTALLDPTCKALEDTRARLNDIPFRRDGFALFEGGLTRSFRRVRRRLLAAAEDRTPLAFHELRKVVKVHQHHLHAFESVFPELLEPRRKLVSALADKLGDQHDFALLSQRLTELGLNDVSAAANEFGQKLEGEILKQAPRLFAEKARVFSATLRAFYRVFEGSAP